LPDRRAARTLGTVHRLPALALAVALATAPAAARAETVLSVYVGLSFTGASDVHVRRPGTDLTYENVSWRTRSLSPPIYLGIRLTHWFGGGDAWGAALDFTHDKAYPDLARPLHVRGQRAGGSVDGTEPLRRTFDRLSISHGVNYLTANALRRFDLGDFAPRVGAGVGLLVPHVEAHAPGLDVEEFQLGGLGLKLLAGAEWSPARLLSAFGEYELSRAYLDLDLPDGSVETALTTHHAVAGGSVRLPFLE
jgi:opacity protein-like surface antigen